MHHSHTPGQSHKCGLSCRPELHKAAQANSLPLRPCALTLNARGAEKHLWGLSRAQQGAPPGHSFSQEHANMYPPEGRPAGHGTSPLSAFQHLVHLKSARKTSCKLSWHRQPHANKACMEGHTGAVGPASGCDALGPRLHSPRQTFRQSLSQHAYYAKAVPYAVSLLHARFYYALPLNPMHFFLLCFLHLPIILLALEAQTYQVSRITWPRDSKV